jgi:penicillin-binding protein 2
MLIFDQLRKDDRQLRAMAMVVLGGLGVLLAGLWWVQIVSARDYQESLETQSFRTVRIPAVRGRILDREGQVLAENRPTYNISLYLEELDGAFKQAYSNDVRSARLALQQGAEAEQRRLHRSLTKTERKQFALTVKDKNLLHQRARCEAASNVVWQVGQRLHQPLTLDTNAFDRHYEQRLALPFQVLSNISPQQIARFSEQCAGINGVDIEVLSSRIYPNETIAAHLLGALRRDDSSAEGEESFFSFRLPDYRGSLGIEFGYDKTLRGLAGAKSVLVNNLGYRQTENVWSPAEPGTNVVLTLDLKVQAAAEQALQEARTNTTSGGPVRGAVVVMDVTTGDILAMASSPTINPNDPLRGYPPGEWQRRHDPVLMPEINRATQMNYMPGSIFKTVVGMACLEAGLNPEEIVHVEPNPAQPTKGGIQVGRRHIKDTAPPGDFNFKRALKLSSNSYFITQGLRCGPERIVRLGQRLHFGEHAGLPTRQDVAGSFPSLQRLKSGWTEGNTANLSIGQDPVWVTPLQIAVLTSAIANHGKVLWPRLVDHIEAPDPTSMEPPTTFPSCLVRDELGLSERTFRILHQAMLADTEDPDGTGRKAAVPGLRICAKTGTAQVQDEDNRKTGLTTWFTSFAPYEHPRYAVVVMVEDGVSGGLTCAPVAGKVYSALVGRDHERMAQGKPSTLAVGTP